jgi:hypothetical protein
MSYFELITFFEIILLNLFLKSEIVISTANYESHTFFTNLQIDNNQANK